MSHPHPIPVFSMLVAMLLCAGGVQALDLSRANILLKSEDPVVATAARVLVEETAKRTGITLNTTVAIPSDTEPMIVLAIDSEVDDLASFLPRGYAVPEQAEGFAVFTAIRPGLNAVVLAGHDGPGVLYAVGRLLLTMELRPGSITLHDDFKIASAPRYPNRGHQIGYRNLAHCYDAWTPAIYEQYMRELAVFGANAFETTSYSNPDEKDGPHTKLTRGEMSVAWSIICADYGFDFWMFTSAMGGEGETKEEEEARMDVLLTMLRAIPHLDHLYLTGGDGSSNHRRPDLMFEALGRFAPMARELHPELGIWTSNQGADPEQNNWFFDYLQHEEPEWLTGIIYGAWNRIPAKEQRERTPSRYPIRRYDDIGHAVRAQYTVPEWDRAYARTLGREPFAPRPRGAANIHNLYDAYSDGFVTYSDGIGDDVNKFVWTALGWDPDRPLDKILLDYARFFFGPDIAEDVRTGLYRFEENFNEPMATCEGIEENYRLWKDLEANADEALKGNWRFQSCVMRATFDHYNKIRLLKAMDQEERALAVLRKAPDLGAKEAIAQARILLAEPDQDDSTAPLRKSLEALGAALFESIGAQLDVEHYKAHRSERGAILDFLETPMNNRRWLEDEFDAIETGRFTATMPEGAVEGDLQLARLERVANWETPGEGSFYDDLGFPWKQPHLVKQKTQWEDPGSLESPREGHTMLPDDSPDRLSWLDVTEALCGTPVLMHYDNLDPNACYRVKVTYLGRYNATIRLTADDKYPIHGSYGNTREGVRYTISRDSAAVPVDDEAPVTPLEFIIPRAATKDGKLDLRWDRDTGRGIQIAEVWLLKERGPCNVEASLQREGEKDEATRSYAPADPKSLPSLDQGLRDKLQNNEP